jgi:hypothetical protein
MAASGPDDLRQARAARARRQCTVSPPSRVRPYEKPCPPPLGRAGPIDMPSLPAELAPLVEFVIGEPRQLAATVMLCLEVPLVVVWASAQSLFIRSTFTASSRLSSIVITIFMSDSSRLFARPKLQVRPLPALLIRRPVRAARAVHPGCPRADPPRDRPRRAAQPAAGGGREPAAAVVGVSRPGAGYLTAERARGRLAAGADIATLAPALGGAAHLLVTEAGETGPAAPAVAAVVTAVLAGALPWPGGRGCSGGPGPQRRPGGRGSRRYSPKGVPAPLSA